jgi:hypothetical protein
MVSWLNGTIFARSVVPDVLMMTAYSSLVAGPQRAVPAPWPSSIRNLPIGAPWSIKYVSNIAPARRAVSLKAADTLAGTSSAFACVCARLRSSSNTGAVGFNGTQAAQPAIPNTATAVSGPRSASKAMRSPRPKPRSLSAVRIPSMRSRRPPKVSGTRPGARTAAASGSRRA